MPVKIQTLSRDCAVELWGDGTTLPVTDPKNLTSDEVQLQKLISGAMISMLEGNISHYEMDIQIGIKLYTEMLPLTVFPLRMASDDGVWRRLTLCVAPESVAVRWPLAEAGETGDIVFPKSHFWSNSQRNWLKSVWWYVHLSWQGTAGQTMNVLKKGSTDAVMHLVERPGSGGFRVEFCRELMACLLLRKGFGVTQLKSVLKMHTARVLLVEPEACEGGVREYVNDLVDAALGNYL